MPVTTEARLVLAALNTHPEAFPAAQGAIEKAILDVFAAQFKAGKLDNVRTLQAVLGQDAFAALVGKVTPKEVTKVAKALDPDNDALKAKTVADPVAKARLLELAGGASPAKAYDLAKMDLDGLRTAAAEMADGFEGWLDLQGAKLKPAVTRLDKNLPGLKSMSTSQAKDHLLALVRGGVQPAKAYDLTKMDLEALRAAASEMGEGFEGWLKAQQPPKLKAKVLALDPGYPGIGKGPTARHVERLAALAKGEEPFQAPDIATLDVAGLRAAKERLGEEMFDAWLSACKPADLKAALVRIDRDRPKVDRLKKDEYPIILTDIAGGGALYQVEGAGPGIGERSFPMGGTLDD